MNRYIQITSMNIRSDEIYNINNNMQKIITQNIIPSSPYLNQIILPTKKITYDNLSPTINYDNNLYNIQSYPIQTDYNNYYQNYGNQNIINGYQNQINYNNNTNNNLLVINNNNNYNSSRLNQKYNIIPYNNNMNYKKSNYNILSTPTPVLNRNFSQQNYFTTNNKGFNVNSNQTAKTKENIIFKNSISNSNDKIIVNYNNSRIINLKNAKLNYFKNKSIEKNGKKIKNIDINTESQDYGQLITNSNNKNNFRNKENNIISPSNFTFINCTNLTNEDKNIIENLKKINIFHSKDKNINEKNINQNKNDNERTFENTLRFSKSVKSIKNKNASPRIKNLNLDKYILNEKFEHSTFNSKNNKF